jgi:hypothetical protein
MTHNPVVDPNRQAPKLVPSFDGRQPDDTLSDDFADVRALAFPGDTRRLMDMRRSGVVEAIAGNAGSLGLSVKLANPIERSSGNRYRSKHLETFSGAKTGLLRQKLTLPKAR